MFSAGNVTRGGGPWPNDFNGLLKGQPTAIATARFVMTATRLARYSALAWISAFSPSASTLSPFSAAGLKLEVNAGSAAGQRNTTGPAPVPATRTAPPTSATNTPTVA